MEANCSTLRSWGSESSDSLDFSRSEHAGRPQREDRKKEPERQLSPDRRGARRSVGAQRSDPRTGVFPQTAVLQHADQAELRPGKENAPEPSVKISQEADSSLVPEMFFVSCNDCKMLDSFRTVAAATHLLCERRCTSSIGMQSWMITGRRRSAAAQEADFL